MGFRLERQRTQLAEYMEVVSKFSACVNKNRRSGIPDSQISSFKSVHTSTASQPFSSEGIMQRHIRKERKGMNKAPRIVKFLAHPGQLFTPQIASRLCHYFQALLHEHQMDKAHQE
eukprot:1150255-Pelagomonas_calceolata.AAC.8